MSEGKSQASDDGRPSGRGARRITLVEGLVAVAFVGLFVGLFLPASRSAGPAARRAQCQNSLKNIALALSNYQQMHGAWPPAYTVDSQGRALHSWRTLILPDLDAQDVYKMIDLSKPWDDPANAAARDVAPAIYRCPDADRPRGMTTYLALVGPSSGLAPGRPRPASEVKDPPGSTLLVLDADDDRAVHWMEPKDVDASYVMGLGRNPKLHHLGTTNGAYFDGTVRELPAGGDDEVRRALTTIAGGDDGPRRSD